MIHFPARATVVPRGDKGGVDVAILGMGRGGGPYLHRLVLESLGGEILIIEGGLHPDGGPVYGGHARGFLQQKHLRQISDE